MVVVVVVADHDDLAGGGEKGSRPPRKRKDHGGPATGLPPRVTSAGRVPALRPVVCRRDMCPRRSAWKTSRQVPSDGDNRPVAEWVLCCIAPALPDGADSAWLLTVCNE